MNCDRISDGPDAALCHHFRRLDTASSMKNGDDVGEVEQTRRISDHLAVGPQNYVTVPAFLSTPGMQSKVNFIWLCRYN